MRFMFEAPERELEFNLSLKGSTDSVAIVGGPGSGKSLLASAMLLAVAGEPSKGSRTLRGVFPSLVWAGEGCQATFEKRLNEKCQVTFHPYGPDDQPNFIDYESSVDIHDSVALVSGMGNMVFACNVKTNMLLESMRTREPLREFIQEVLPGVKYTWESLGSILQYMNRATPPAYSTLACCVTAYAAVAHCSTVITDFCNPGIPPDNFAAMHAGMIALAERRSTKLISFLPTRQIHQADYTHVVRI